MVETGQHQMALWVGKVNRGRAIGLWCRLLSTELALTKRQKTVTIGKRPKRGSSGIALSTDLDAALMSHWPSSTEMRLRKRWC